MARRRGPYAPLKRELALTSRYFSWQFWRRCGIYPRQHDRVMRPGSCGGGLLKISPFEQLSDRSLVMHVPVYGDAAHILTVSTAGTSRYCPVVVEIRHVQDSKPVCLLPPSESAAKILCLLINASDLSNPERAAIRIIRLLAHLMITSESLSHDNDAGLDVSASLQPLCDWLLCTVADKVSVAAAICAAEMKPPMQGIIQVILSNMPASLVIRACDNPF